MAVQRGAQCLYYYYYYYVVVVVVVVVINVDISMLVMYYAGDIAGYDKIEGDQHWLSNAPLDGSPRYDNHSITQSI